MVFRLFRLFLRPRRQGRIDLSIWDTTQTTFRVRLRDLDVLRHMNNSVYLAVLDLGRMDLVVRSGLWAALKRNGIYPVVANQTITYRKSLKFGDRFDVETRVVGVDEICVYFEQRFTRNAEIYAQALVRQRFLRRSGGVVPIKDLMQWVDPVPEGREVAPWMQDWTANTALPSTRAPAVSTWTNR